MLPARFTFAGEDGTDEWWDFQLDGYGTWLWALVEHLERQRPPALDQAPDLPGCEAGGAGVRGSCTFLDSYFVTLALDGQIIPEIYGNSTVTDTQTGQTQTTIGTVGLNNKVWMLSLTPPANARSTSPSRSICAAWMRPRLPAAQAAPSV